MTAIYIGDAVTAAGLRLAGLRVCIVEPSEIAQTLEAELEGASLLLLSAEHAAALEPLALERLLARLEPLVLLLSDHRLRWLAPSPAALARACIVGELDATPGASPKRRASRAPRSGASAEEPRR